MTTAHAKLKLGNLIPVLLQGLRY
uniref:Uncharacterized protein n=1 Tax=Anguilla anguilla TaxID=7936 RepID=A0A0E9PZL0_ANGAN